MQKNLGSVACVFGCSGFLGSNLVAPLIREGWRIIAVTRSPYKNNKLKMFGPPGDVDLEKLGNLSDEEGIRKFLKVSTVVINLVGILNPARRNSFQDIHVQFPKKISKLCSEYKNIKKLIHISSGGIEASSATSSYAKSKLDGEKIILENLKNKSIILRPGIILKNLKNKSIILRPGIIVGIDDKFFNLFGTLSQFLPALPIIGNPSMQPVYVGDVVKSIVAVVEKEEIENNIYEIFGKDQYTFKQLMQLLLKEIRKKRLLLNIPFPVAKILARFAELLPKPLLTRDSVELLRYRNCPTGKYPGLKELNIKPTSIESVLPQIVWRYRQGGQFS